MIISKKKIIASAMALSLLAGGAANLSPVINHDVGGTAIVADAATKKSIKNAKVTLSKTTYTYQPSLCGPIMPSVTVKLGTKTLRRGIDYNAEYSTVRNSKVCNDAGTATVTITGKGNYKGTQTLNFTIKKKNASYLFERAKINNFGASYTNTAKRTGQGWGNNSSEYYPLSKMKSTYYTDLPSVMGFSINGDKFFKNNIKYRIARSGKNLIVTFSAKDSKNYTGIKKVVFKAKN